MLENHLRNPKENHGNHGKSHAISSTSICFPDGFPMDFPWIFQPWTGTAKLPAAPGAMGTGTVKVRKGAGDA